jgi:peptidoglycan/xylan/chitin deacetylase (PgdA/CDA1 family)
MSATAALLYHNVGEVMAEECRGITVAPEAFAHHMGALQAMGFVTIRPDEWVSHVRSNTPLPPRAVLITFDDAYSSLALYAFPELEKRKMTAVVFVSTSLVGQSLGCTPSAGSYKQPVLTDTQINDWSRRGIEFGAHAHHHVDLTAISPEALERELDESMTELARITGKAVTSMAYPYGKTSDSVRKMSGSIFDACFTIEEGLNDRATPLDSLRRTMVQHGDNVADVCLRAAYGKSPLATIRTAVTRTFRDLTGKA